MRRTKRQSGYEKKKKRQRLEAAAQSQKGALDRFVVKESRINSENETSDATVDDGHGVDGFRIARTWGTTRRTRRFERRGLNV
jgi:hypothetical protein